MDEKTFPDAGVVDVQIEDETELSSYRKSELGLEQERACPLEGGLADILVDTLFLRIFTKPGSETMECLGTIDSIHFFEGGGVTSMESVRDCSFNIDSHGLAAIHLSNQLHPQLFLSNSEFLRA